MSAIKDCDWCGAVMRDIGRGSYTPMRVARCTKCQHEIEYVATPSLEELEAIHGVCGNPGCEQALADGRCGRCDRDNV